MSLIEPDIRAQIKLMTCLEGSSSTVEEPSKPQIPGARFFLLEAPPVWLLTTGQHRVAQGCSAGSWSLGAVPNTASSFVASPSHVHKGKVQWSEPCDSEVPDTPRHG